MYTGRMDRETLKALMIRNLVRLAKEQYKLPRAKSDCEITPGEWGTDMTCMCQAFSFELELCGRNRTLELAGRVCLTEFPGTDNPPEVTGSIDEWNFKFFL